MALPRSTPVMLKSARDMGGGLDGRFQSPLHGAGPWQCQRGDVSPLFPESDPCEPLAHCLNWSPQPFYELPVPQNRQASMPRFFAAHS